MVPIRPEVERKKNYSWRLIKNFSFVPQKNWLCFVSITKGRQDQPLRIHKVQQFHFLWSSFRHKGTNSILLAVAEKENNISNRFPCWIINSVHTPGFPPGITNYSVLYWNIQRNYTIAPITSIFNAPKDHNSP